MGLKLLWQALMKVKQPSLIVTTSIFAESRVKLSGKGKKKGRGNRASKSSKKSKKAKKGKGVVFAPANQKQQIQLAKPASVKQAEKSLGKSLPYDDRKHML